MKDVCYASLFVKDDLPYLYKYAAKVRQTHNQDLVDDFNRKCQQKYDDHKPFLQVDNEYIEFLDVRKADDLVVTTGINQCIDQILGTSVTRWQYMARGTSTSTPTAGQSILVAESGTRINMSLFGWREYASTSLRFGAIHGENTGFATFTECGVFTTLTAGIMLNRNMFSNNPLTHSPDINAYVISSIIEFVPVV